MSWYANYIGCLLTDTICILAFMSFIIGVISMTTIVYHHFNLHYHFHFNYHHYRYHLLYHHHHLIYPLRSWRSIVRGIDRSTMACPWRLPLVVVVVVVVVVVTLFILELSIAQKN